VFKEKEKNMQKLREHWTEK